MLSPYRTCRATLAALGLVLGFPAWSQPSAGDRDGTEITVVHAERTKQWKQRRWPDTFSKPVPMGQTYKTKSGAEFVVYRVRIQSRANKIHYQKLEARDVNGKPYTPFIGEIEWEVPSGKALDVMNEIPFVVPEATRLKMLRIDSFSFGVEELARPGERPARPPIFQKVP